MGDIVEHTWMICGEAFCLVDGLLWKLEPKEYSDEDE
jgi:hypothetical protein